MNLELLDPFRRQIPDRIDSTLTLPRTLHPRRPRAATNPTSASAGATTTGSSVGAGSKGGSKGANTNPPSSSVGGAELGVGVVPSSVPSTSVAVDVGSSPNNPFPPPSSGPSARSSDVSSDGGSSRSVLPSTGQTGDAEPSDPLVGGGSDTGVATSDIPAGAQIQKSRRRSSNEGEGPDGVSSSAERAAAGTDDAAEGGGGGGETAKEENDDEDEDGGGQDAEAWRACYHVSFNRRGTYLAAGHGSGAVAVHDFMSRTLSALYRPPPPPGSGGQGGGAAGGSGTEGAKGRGRGKKRKTPAGAASEADSVESGGGSSGRGKKRKLPSGGDYSASSAVVEGEAAAKVPNLSLMGSSSTSGSASTTPEASSKDSNGQQHHYHNGVTSITWSRRSRTLLAGAIGDRNLRLMDNTHPLGPEDCVVSRPDGAKGPALAPPAGVSVSAVGVGADVDDDGTGEESATPAVPPAAQGAKKTTKEKKGRGKKDKKNAGSAGGGGGPGSGSGTVENESMRARIIKNVVVLEPGKSWYSSTDREKGSVSGGFATKTAAGGSDVKKATTMAVDRKPVASTAKPSAASAAVAGASSASAGGGGNAAGGVTNSNDLSFILLEQKTLQERHEAALKRMRLEQEKKELKGNTGKKKGGKKGESATAETDEHVGLDTLPSAQIGRHGHGGPLSLSKGEPPDATIIATASASVSSSAGGGGGGSGTGSGGRKKKSKKKDQTVHSSASRAPPPRRYQTLILPLPQPVGGSLQVHPRDGCAGLACLADGSLILFRFPPAAFHERFVPHTAGAPPPWAASVLQQERDKVGKIVYVVPPPKAEKQQHQQQSKTGKKGSPTSGGGGTPYNEKQYFVTCAAFDKHGEVLYAVTKCGTLLGFRVCTQAMDGLRSPVPRPSSRIPTMKPAFRIKLPGGASALQVVVSRNGRLVLINSADSALRLFVAEECWSLEKRQPQTAPGAGGKASVLPKTVGSNFGGGGLMMSSPTPLPPPSTSVKPRFVFQDLVSKAPWASCDFSGDGEYVVGGCNNSTTLPGDKYELYLWNTTTGALIDQLTGPQVSLYSLSWHPTRSFIAVGTSDGLVDMWGPRMDWTAFAPDFQALPMNVEYVEREDEFDVVVDNDNDKSERERKVLERTMEEESVDVVTVERVPVFDSDSESEGEVFHFETKILAVMAGRGRSPAGAGAGAGAGAASSSGGSAAGGGIQAAKAVGAGKDK